MQLVEITLGILAGGKGQRMGGRDKGLIVTNGEPLIARLCHSPEVSTVEVMVTCKQNPWLYQHYADRVLCDLEYDQGPLAGVVAMLYACQSPLLFILPCDQQTFDHRWISQLQIALEPQALGIYARDNSRHTACFMLRKSALVTVQRIYDEGCRSLAGLYRELELPSLGIDGAGCDIDEPEDRV